MNSQREKFEEAFKRPKFVELIDDEYRMVGDYTPETFMNFMEFCARWQGWQAATEQGVGETAEVSELQVALYNASEAYLDSIDKFSWDKDKKILRHQVKLVKSHAKALTHPPKPTGVGVPDGWKLVPIEPTKGMLVHTFKEVTVGSESNYKEIWSAMLEATPQPPER